MMKRLPLGTQDFNKIIENNLLYVDKTKFITNLIHSGGTYFFLSRPRRFGKSLLVSTLKEIFEGNKELFKDLYIYDKIKWKKHPVIHVDFSKIAYADTEALKQSLDFFINEVARKYDITLFNTFIGSKFAELIQKICELKKEKVVVLIDEYDKPILEHITDIHKARAVRQVLREFYGILKPSDPYLRFVLLTGVSKFSQGSIFSDLNNLNDITLDTRYSELLGITEDEFIHYFNDYIEDFSHTRETSRNKLLSDIKYWYNGYSWDGEKRVYNPFSLLSLFDKSQFKNYWFATGTPTFLVNLIQEKKYNIPEVENYEISESPFASYDIENIDIIILLFQTGYVTIKKRWHVEGGESLYTLDYPNFEVKESLLRSLMASIGHIPDSKVKPLIDNLSRALQENDIPTFISLLKSIVAGIPYTLIEENESYYHTIFYLVVTLMGAKVEPEVLTNQGRIDCVLELTDRIYIIEFKYGKDTVKNYALKAIKQIKTKKYHEKYIKSKKKIYLLGIGFIKKRIEYKVQELKEKK